MKLYPYICIFLAAAALAACDARPDAAQVEEAQSLPADGGAIAVTADRLLVNSDGETGEVRLAGIIAPRSEPSASLARGALQAMLDDAAGRLTLEPVGPGRNRHGTLIAELSGPDGSIQDRLIDGGWVMVDSHDDHTGPTASRLEREERARNAGLGAWAHDGLSVLGTDPNALAPHLDSVVIIEGRVIATGSARDGRVYLNFGMDWRTDFTVQVLRRDQSRFEDAGVDLRALDGAVIRVRGWLYEENGPMITLDHREAMELIDAPEPAPLPGR